MSTFTATDDFDLDEIWMEVFLRTCSQTYPDNAVAPFAVKEAWTRANCAVRLLKAMLNGEPVKEKFGEHFEHLVGYEHNLGGSEEYTSIFNTD